MIQGEDIVSEYKYIVLSPVYCFIAQRYNDIFSSSSLSATSTRSTAL